MNKPWIKEDRKQKALEHIEDMQATYPDDIENSINRSSYCRFSIDLPVNDIYSTNNVPVISVEPISSTEAAIKYAGPKSALLNFASYKYAGGGFVIGAIAQEEAICHDSTLYNVIGSDKFAKLYEWNRNNIKNSLYENFAIYSPGIVFEDKDQKPYYCDVLTCAAPNLSAWNGSKLEAEQAMCNRIKFVLDMAQVEGVETLILGAFGCGVFKNDPTFVAEMFKKYLQSGKYSFKKVVFAIPGGPNFTSFAETFRI